MPGDTQNSRDEASNVDDHDLIQALINENVQLRKTLSEVSAVGGGFPPRCPPMPH